MKNRRRSSAGALKFDTPIPTVAATSLKIEWLTLTNVISSIDADAVRKYIGKLPADLHGPIDSSLTSLSVSGHTNSRPGKVVGFSGDVNFQDLSVHSPPGPHVINFDLPTIAPNAHL